MRTLLAAVGIILVGSQVSATAPEPAEATRFVCQLTKKDDTFQVVAPKPGAEVFRIRSASGIGGATITCREGQWPETVTVVFVGMNKLEQLTIEGNGLTLKGRIANDNKPAVFYFNER